MIDDKVYLFFQLFMLSECILIKLMILIKKKDKILERLIKIIYFDIYYYQIKKYEYKIIFNMEFSLYLEYKIYILILKKKI